MGELLVLPIKNLNAETIHELVEESKRDGFRFLERLVSEYQQNENRFNQTGEILLGVYNGNKLIAVGGINQDPYTQSVKQGRLRRVYVSKSNRKAGIGRQLCMELLAFAKKHYEVVVLHTDTLQGDLFYQSLGFQKGTTYNPSSHYKFL